MSTNESDQRQYTCLDCGEQVELFLGGCPGCGGTAFSTGDGSDPGKTEQPRTREVANLAAAVNPYVPR